MNSVIGPVSYGGKDSKESFQKPFSEKTGEMLDNEVRKMILYVPNIHDCSLAVLIICHTARRTSVPRIF